MKKIIITIVAVIMAVGMCFAFTACNNKDEGTLTVGMECGYAPFNYTQTNADNGAVSISNATGYYANGYDVMIAKKIAESLGKKLVIVKYDFNALINAVKSDSLDLIIAGMSPTEERKKEIDFSDAYYKSQLVIVVRKDGNYANAKSLTDFNGAKIVAQQGTFHDTALEEQSVQYGIERQTPMEDFPTMITALKSKTIDGYVAEAPGAKSDCASNSELTYIALVNNDTGFKASEEDVQIAVGMKKGSEYKDKVNSVLASLDSDTRFTMMEEATTNAPKTDESTSNLWKQMWNILKRYWRQLLWGVAYTVIVSIAGTIVGLLIGLLIGIYRTASKPRNWFTKILRAIGYFIVNLYIEIFRGTPMMVQAMVIYWGYAFISGGTTLNVLLAGFVIVSINTGAYMAEIVRGGIISIDKGQTEGSQAIGMKHGQMMRSVVLPQVMRNILPSIANEFVINIKDTSVLNVIGFAELYWFAKDIAATTFQTFATYLLIAAIYFVLTFIITRILRLIEKKMAGKKNYVIFGSQSDFKAEIRVQEKAQ